MNKNYILLALIILGFNLDACKKETNKEKSNQKNTNKTKFKRFQIWFSHL